jgi:hypothetical protein
MLVTEEQLDGVCARAKETLWHYELLNLPYLNIFACCRKSAIKRGPILASMSAVIGFRCFHHLSGP